MPVGRTFPSEVTEFKDPASGATVRKLTNDRTHSHHLYFTNPGWFDGGKRLVIVSQRTGFGQNVFGLELASGELTQLTDFADGFSALSGCVNPKRDEGYFRYRDQIVAVDLHSGAWRPIYRRPAEHTIGNLNATADGRYVCTFIYKPEIDGDGAVIQRQYHRFRERMESRPLSRIVRVPVDGGKAETVWEERCLLGHVNTSPTMPNMLTFCHEGPWEYVDHRIWALDHTTGNAMKLREREVDQERIGHEYWYADGEHVGYHGSRPDGSKFFGRVRYDDTDRVEVDFPHPLQHIHSNDLSLIVADGGHTVKLWQWTGEGFAGPRILCEHWCSPFVQICHVHPRFNADASQVLFTTNSGGYGNPYLADVPPFESLPEASPGD